MKNENVINWEKTKFYDTGVIVLDFTSGTPPEQIREFNEKIKHCVANYDALLQEARNVIDINEKYRQLLRECNPWNNGRCVACGASEGFIHHINCDYVDAADDTNVYNLLNFIEAPTNDIVEEFDAEGFYFNNDEREHLKVD